MTEIMYNVFKLHESYHLLKFTEFIKRTTGRGAPTAAEKTP